MREPGGGLVRSMSDTARYSGSSKHKLRPRPYDLPPFNGDRGDATLCDEAGFDPTRMAGIPALVRRGIRAGLIGHTGRIVRTVADDGWIFEARETNRDTAEFHGYPVLATEAVARAVFDRFSGWAAEHGTREDRFAGESCRHRYGFR